MMRASGSLWDDGRARAVLARPLCPGELRAVHLDLLGRPPLAAEHEARQGRGLGELLGVILGTPEFWREWMEEQLYYFLLVDNFRPVTERIQAAPEALAEGLIDVRDALHQIALTPSFDLRNPGADTYVTVVMEQICGLRVQRRPRELEIGKRIYDGSTGSFLGRSGSSQADIVRIALESREAAATLAAREYGRYLHAPIDAATLRDWTRSLHERPDSFLSLLRSALGSDAYLARLQRRVPLPNRLFVRCLFVDLKDRLPSDAEAQRMREALDGLGDSTPLRSILIRLVLDSGAADLPPLPAVADRRAFVAERFRRLLGREAEEPELAAFDEAMAHPSCRTETVLQAILSHPEYHRY